MEMPRPGAPHQRLDEMVGTWTGEEKIHPSPMDPEGGTAEATVVNRKALGGFVVIQDYEQRRGGQVSFTGHGVVRWDPDSSEYVMHWFDSMGMPPDEFRGDFSGDVLTLASRNPQGHFRTTFDFGAADAYTFKMEVSPDGEHWHPFLEGSYRRSAE